MKFLRKKDDISYQLASMQARIFERSAQEKIPSYFFIQKYMLSEEVAVIDDLSFLQSGLSELEIYLNVKNKVKRTKGSIYSLEEIYWIGFIYRYANYLIGISSKKLFKLINPNNLIKLYPLYHSLDVQKAIEMIFDNININKESPMDRFINLYKDKKIML